MIRARHAEDDQGDNTKARRALGYLVRLLAQRVPDTLEYETQHLALEAARASAGIGDTARCLRHDPQELGKEPPATALPVPRRAQSGRFIV
jgi:hypothetical protein